MGRRRPLSSSPMWVFLIILSTIFSLRVNASNVVVIGSGDCADCAEKKIEKTHALSGLKVTIECVAPNGEVKTRGASVLKKDGAFNVDLSNEVVDHTGALKEECYVQFHSASKRPCPAHNGLEKTSKVVLKSKEENGEKLIFTTAGKMSINPELCSSEYLWHYWKHPPLSPYPVTYSHPWLAPPIPYYQHPWFKHPVYSSPPVYTAPPIVPIYKPPVKPIYKPPVVIYKPPVVPIYKPPIVIYKPPVIPIHKPPIVIYKPPVVPIHKPPIVIYKPPVVPIYKPPIVVYKPPVIYKKPCPPKLPYKHPWGIYKKPYPPLPPHYGWPPLPKHPWLPPSKS